MLRKLATALVVLLVIAVSLPVIAAVLGSLLLGSRAFRAPSEAMLPTIEPGDRVVTTRSSNPGRGDIVVLYAPAGADDGECGVRQRPTSPCPRPKRGRSKSKFIKRVTAVAGDRLSIRDAHAVIDGKVQREPYIRPPDSQCPACDLPDEITIPAGHVFVMGDNRGESSDSREWGPVPTSSVVGEVRLRYWPPSRAGTP